MEAIVFATNNPHKLVEVRQIFGNKFHIKSLSDVNITEDIPETTPTIEGNALQKARYIYDKYKLNCFSEDTGLEVEALNGEPGVDTAHYAGPERSAEANMNLLLQNLEPHTNRAARFKTVIALILDGEEHLFEGIVEGRIGMEKRGTGGFGYDPIFYPSGYKESFAELSSEIKNKIGHRGRAVAGLEAFLMG